MFNIMGKIFVDAALVSKVPSMPRDFHQPAPSMSPYTFFEDELWPLHRDPGMAEGTAAAAVGPMPSKRHAVTQIRRPNSAPFTHNLALRLKPFRPLLR